ncbi:DUF4397 domain-containing protein [Clostridium malenominatum]|uniref:DUF4397 domain-containing protein n=1 Tax=Clostridium malenominatum TaxID=1539 RepID=A0ABN1IXI6_9CLOT
MYICPYFTPNQYRSPEEASYIRIFHASPNAPAVDIYINNRLTVRNLGYRQFTQYLKITPGNYNIKVYPAGNTETPVLNLNAQIENNTILTAAAVGLLPNLNLQLIKDTPMTIPEGKVMIRLAHLSPDAPAVDGRINNSNVTFENLSFSNVSDYQSLNPGVYTLEVTPAGSDDVILIVPNINLKANRFYTIYIIGLALGSPSLQVVIPLDGNSYIKF